MATESKQTREDVAEIKPVQRVLAKPDYITPLQIKEKQEE